MDKQGLYQGPSYHQLCATSTHQAQHEASPRPLTRLIPPPTVPHATSMISLGLQGAFALGIGGASLSSAGVKKLQHQQTHSRERWAAADQREAPRQIAVKIYLPTHLLTLIHISYQHKRHHAEDTGALRRCLDARVCREEKQSAASARPALVPWGSLGWQ